MLRWLRRLLIHQPPSSLDDNVALEELRKAPSFDLSAVSFGNFTDRARKVMALANQEAQRFNHEYVGTQHILLGLVKDGSGVGANVLKNLDVDLRKVRHEVEKLVKPGPNMVTMGRLPTTPLAKQVLVHAIDEASQLQHSYVGTEHLLLGLLRGGQQDDVADGNIAGRVLANLGLKLDRVREEVLNLLGVAEGVPMPLPVVTSSALLRLNESAHELARDFKHEQLNTAHHLLAMLEQPNCHAASALREAAVDLEELRQHLHQLASTTEPQ